LVLDSGEELLDKAINDSTHLASELKLSMEQPNQPPPANPPKPYAYFVKASISNPVLVRGAAVPFEPVGSNWGVLALDTSIEGNKPVLDALNEFIKRGVGGVGRISAAEYAQKKSQPILKPFGPRNAPLRSRPLGPSPRKAPAQAVIAAAAVPAVEPPAEPPIDLSALKSVGEAQATPESFRPPTRRISRRPVGTAPAIVAAPPA